MARELRVQYQGSATIYAILRRLSDDKVWSVADSAWTTWADGDIGDYDIALSNRSGDYYSADRPSSIAVATSYRAIYYIQAGASPATSDVLLTWEEQTAGSTATTNAGSGGGFLTLETARGAVRSALLQPSNSGIEDVDIDRGIKLAGDEFVRRTRLLQKVDDSLALTANVATLSVSSLTDFRPERLQRVEVAYPDQGTWATATSYSELDLVQGDGDPDSFYYVCVEDHTSSSSNQPPNATYWRRVAWTTGFPVQQVDYYRLANKLNVASDASLNIASSTAFDVGRPREVGFRDATTAFFWPVPNAAWGVRLYYEEPFTAWTLGTASPGDVTLNIPAEYLYPVLYHGAVAFIQFHDADYRFGSSAWQRFEAHIRQVKGNVGIDGGATVLDESQFI